MYLRAIGDYHFFQCNSQLSVSERRPMCKPRHLLMY